MAHEVRCRLQFATVQPARKDDLQALIDYCFARRTLAHVDAWDRIRHGEEVVHSLRRRSPSYCTISTETSGPLLFELGFFRITTEGATNEDALEPIARALPNPHPEPVALVLSDFLEPGARILFGEEGRLEAWTVEGKGSVRKEEAPVP